MKSNWVRDLATAAVLLAVVSFLIAPKSSGSDKMQSFVGQVTDAMCGASHMEPGATPADCTRTCVSKGSKYALAVNDKVYTLDTDDKAALDELNALAGQKVKVTGTLKDDTIKVSSLLRKK
jgi:hypothetical protein